MKKRILSFLTGLALAAGCIAMPAAAETADPDAAALLKQIQYGDYHEFTPIPADAGVRTNDGSALPAVTRDKEWIYAGIAFTCADIDALTAAAPTEHLIVRSEGQYLNTYLPFCNEKTEGSEQFLMQPLTGYAEAFAKRCHYDEYPNMNTGTDGDILADFADADGMVYLIASHPDNAETLVTWLYQQNVQILGVGYGTSEDTGWYDNIPPQVYAAPAEGYTLTADMFGAYSKWAAPVENSPFGYWHVDLTPEMTYEEAQAVCETFEENPAIAYTAHSPNQFAVGGITPENVSMALVCPTDSGSGDISDNDPRSAESETLSREAAALLKQIQCIQYQKYTPIPADAGILTNDGSALPAVTYTKYYVYAGIAFTCSALQALAASAPEAHPVIESEGQFLSVTKPYFKGSQKDVFLLQPLTGYAQAFANRSGDDPNTETDGDILADFADADGTVYLIASSTNNAETLVRWLCNQSDVRILGAAYGTSESAGWYDNIPPVVYAAPAEGYTLTQADFGAYSANAVPQPASPFGYWVLELPVGLTYEEAQAICDTLSENPAIAYTAHAGYRYTASDGSALESIGVELVPFRNKGNGDLNGDGDTNIGDAVLLARFNAEDSELDASALNMDEADLNADGVTDALDLAALLCQLANTEA